MNNKTTAYFQQNYFFKITVELQIQTLTLIFQRYSCEFPLSIRTERLNNDCFIRNAYLDNFCSLQTFCTIQSGAYRLSFTCEVTMKALEMYYDPGSAGIEYKDAKQLCCTAYLLKRCLGKFLPFMLRHILDPLSVFGIEQRWLLPISSVRLEDCLNTRMGGSEKIFLGRFIFFFQNRIFFSVIGCNCVMMF